MPRAMPVLARRHATLRAHLRNRNEATHRNPAGAADRELQYRRARARTPRPAARRASAPRTRRSGIDARVTAKRRTPDKAPVTEIAVVAADVPAVAPKLTAIEIADDDRRRARWSIAAARVAEPFLVPVVAGILLAYALRPLSWRSSRTGACRGRWRPRWSSSSLSAACPAAGYVIRDDVQRGGGGVAGRGAQAADRDHRIDAAVAGRDDAREGGGGRTRPRRGGGHGQAGGAGGTHARRRRGDAVPDVRGAAIGAARSTVAERDRAGDAARVLPARRRRHVPAQGRASRRRVARAAARDGRGAERDRQRRSRPTC